MSVAPAERQAIVPAERQAIVDEEQLRLLSLGYVVSGVVTALFSLLGLVYAGIGAIFLALPVPAKEGEPPPAFIGGLFLVLGGAFVLLGAALAAAKLWASRCLKRREKRTFCLVTAAFTCLGFPWGTALGVATFVVLGRPSVAALFAPRATPPAHVPPLPAPPPVPPPPPPV